MTGLLKRLIGVNRPRIVAVIGVTREQVEAGVAHALSGTGGLPVWAWCAEDAAAVPGCERFFGNAGKAGAWRTRRDLRLVWPALSIVSWTGDRGAAGLKLVAFTVPPFRVVIFNEAHGFFGARLPSVTEHAWRRVRDALQSWARRLGDWALGIVTLTRALAVRVNTFWSRRFGYLFDVALAVLAFMAQITPPLARRMVRRARSAPAKPVILAPAGIRFTEIILTGRRWTRRKVLRAVESDVDYIVFRRRGEASKVESLLELARDTGAFATASQIAYTGWRETVVAKHPFRRLQPGEVARVLAPWSVLIAMRRDAVAAFGVPRALTTGAALTTLYWRAAAADLPCFVAGGERDVTQEPAMALEDFEFAARVKSIGLAPAHPKLSRGNVAWSPAHSKPFREKPRVLVVSPYLPYPLSHGGAVRMYNLCRALCEDIDFVLACFREAKETVHYPELHEIFREVYVVDIDEKRPDTTVPKQVAEYRNSAMTGLIRELCDGRGIDLVQLEYTQMAEYRTAKPTILVEHDITFQLHEQLAGSLNTPEARREFESWRAFERRALEKADAVWTMSQSDRQIAIANGAEKKSTAVVPNGVDLSRYRPENRAGGAPTILFVGSFRHLPNLLAFEALRQTIMLDVWRAIPDARVHVIAGPDHVRAAQLARRTALLAPDPRVTIEGFVEDVRPAYRESDVVAIPLPVSAGTNIKLMEAMACGRAVVSTPVGCHGLDLIDGTDLLVRETGPEFAEAVILLLTDRERRERIAAAARATAELRFDWRAIARDALASYRNLSGA